MLELLIASGETRYLDLAPYMQRSAHFAQLADGRFHAVKVVFGCLEWPGNIDLSNDSAWLKSTAVLPALREGAIGQSAR